MRRILLILLVSISLILLASCYDSNEVDDLLHIIAIGVDRGVTDKWRLTVEFSTLKGSAMGGPGSGGGSGQGQADYADLTVDAPSFFTAINMLNATLSRNLNFMHTEVMMVSEDLAKSGMLGEFIAPIIRFRQIRRTMHVFITKGSAMDYIKFNTPLVGTALSKNLQILIKEANITGFFPHITLNNLYDRMKSTYGQPVAAMTAISHTGSFLKDGEAWQNQFKTGGEYNAGDLPMCDPDRAEIFGCAVFDGDKMVGELTGDETRLMQIADGEFKMGYFTIQDPKEPSLAVTLDVRASGKPKVVIDPKKDGPLIHLKVKLEGDLLAVQSWINYERPDLELVIEEAIQKQIKEGFDKLMKKSKELKTDIFAFGGIAARQFSTIQEWENYNWLSKFQNAEITTEVKFTLRRTGTQIKSSPIQSTEVKK